MAKGLNLHPGVLILGIWIVFWVIWAVTAFNVKRDVRGTRPAWFGYLIRVVVITTAILLIQSLRGGRPLRLSIPNWAHSNAALAYAGVAICALGIGFAVWARVHLGRNWSPAPAIKEEHELVTSGPYRFVRHPIYTGILVAMIGSALASGPAWLVGVAACLVVFVARVRTEEGLMVKLFPTQYPEYRKRTKALIPFVV